MSAETQLPVIISRARRITYDTADLPDSLHAVIDVRADRYRYVLHVHHSSDATSESGIALDQPDE